MSILVKATEKYDHTLDSISGSSARFFRIDNKKDRTRIKEDSRYELIRIDAKTMSLLTVYPKHKMYSFFTREYDDDNDWGKAVWTRFQKKLIQEIDEQVYMEQFRKFIGDR